MKPAEPHANRKLIPTYLPPFSLHDIPLPLATFKPSNVKRPAGHN